jgi:hypothetical protein
MTEEPRIIVIKKDEDDMPIGRRSGRAPGVINGRRVFDKVNTAKKRSRARLERAAEGWNRHIENHPRDEMARKCLSNLNDRLRSIN